MYNRYFINKYLNKFIIIILLNLYYNIKIVQAKKVGDLFDDLGDAIKKGWESFADWITDLAKDAYEKVSGWVEAAGKFVIDRINELVELTEYLVESIIDMVEKVIDALEWLLGEFLELLEKFLDAINKMLQFFSHFDRWIVEQLLKVVKLILEIIFDVYQYISEKLYEIILNEVILKSYEIFELEKFNTYLDINIEIGIGILFMATAYQLLKSLFKPLGFEGESPLNILITFILFFILINLVYYISFMVINLNNIILSNLDYTETINLKFEPYNYPETKNFGSFIKNFVSDCLKIALLSVIFFKMIDLGARFVTRVVLIMIVVLLGPLVLGVGVIKSQRIISLSWFSALVGGNLAYLIKVTMFFFTFSYLATFTEWDYMNMAILLGFILAIEEVEKILGGIMVPMYLTSGSTEGIAKNYRAYLRDRPLNPLKFWRY